MDYSILFCQKIQPQKILQQNLYLFKVAGAIIYPLCTVEKASLNLTCVKNIIIEGREGFNGLHLLNL